MGGWKYMNYITKNGFIDALQRTGIQKGDTVMVHSDISLFGISKNFSIKEILHIFYDAFTEILGSEGTLCVPAYFYEYARYGIPFDITLSPISKELGLFPRFIKSLPNSKRSCNPITSVCAIGKNSDYICEPINRCSYGEESAFDRLYKLNAKIVGLGVTPFTLIHLAEFHVGVPYLYSKIYNIPILNNGEIIFENSIAHVRYLSYDIEYKSQVNRSTATMTWHNEPFISKTKYLNSEIIVAKTQDLLKYVKEKLYQDPYYLLTHIPNLPLGKIPNDGPVLKK